MDSDTNAGVDVVRWMRDGELPLNSHNLARTVGNLRNRHPRVLVERASAPHVGLAPSIAEGRKLDTIVSDDSPRGGRSEDGVGIRAGEEEERDCQPSREIWHAEVPAEG